MNDEIEGDEEPEEQIEEVFSISGGAGQKKPISDKFFYKEMAKIKEKNKSARGGVLPPKKSASAYIIFQKEVSSMVKDYSYFISESSLNLLSDLRTWICCQDLFRVAFCIMFYK